MDTPITDGSIYRIVSVLCDAVGVPVDLVTSMTITPGRLIATVLVLDDNNRPKAVNENMVTRRIVVHYQ